MSKSTTARWGWVAAMVLVSACGGRVGDDDDDDVPREGAAGAGSNTSTTGNGPGSGDGNGNATGGGALCAGTPPHPDYNLCYSTPYPPCLGLGDPSLNTTLGTDRTPNIGPWVGTNAACKMVCCYGIK